MTEREKVIAALGCCFPFGGKGCEQCPFAGEIDIEHGCAVDLGKKIISVLEKQEDLTDNDREDLEMIRRIRAGKSLKYCCHDYTIINNEWKRKHPWAWSEPTEPKLLTYEDLIRSEKIPVWCEVHTADGVLGEWVVYCGTWHTENFEGVMLRGALPQSVLSGKHYGSSWRVWSGEPTKERRNEVPWDERTEV